LWLLPWSPQATGGTARRSRCQAAQAPAYSPGMDLFVPLPPPDRSLLACCDPSACGRKVRKISYTQARCPASQHHQPPAQGSATQTSRWVGLPRAEEPSLLPRPLPLLASSSTPLLIRCCQSRLRATGEVVEDREVALSREESGHTGSLRRVGAMGAQVQRPTPRRPPIRRHHPHSPCIVLPVPCRQESDL